MYQTTTDRTTDDARTAHLTESDRHRLLASDRRRVILDVFSERPGPITLEDLAREVASREADVDGRDEEDRLRVKVTLVHVHLPKMADWGVLAYDLDSGRIEPRR